MVTSSFRTPFLMLLQRLRWYLLPIVAYVAGVSWLDIQFHLEQYNFPVSLVAVFGTVIGLVLAFRTNSSYGRWWEARTIWGAIVNDSRSWTRQLLEFTRASSSTDQVVKTMAYRQIGWCYSLARNLRGQDPLQDLDDIVDRAEIESYQGSFNVPNDLLLQQAVDLKRLYSEGHLELFQWIELERTMVRLTNSMGGCERIKNTPFPLSYSRFIDVSIYIFVFFMPFGLFNVPAIALVITSLVLSLAFLSIEQVAIFLEDPFNNNPTDTPMLALSRTIEINIRQMLGEQSLPPKQQPVNGILM